jgi:hypothetical protein
VITGLKNYVVETSKAYYHALTSRIGALHLVLKHARVDADLVLTISTKALTFGAGAGEHHRLAGRQQLVVHLHVCERKAHALVRGAQPIVSMHLQQEETPALAQLACTAGSGNCAILQG